MAGMPDVADVATDLATSAPRIEVTVNRASRGQGG